jgi:anti-sigma factor RsiW
MTPDRFRAFAEAYGGDLGRWPQAERGEAERLLATSPEAVAILADARGLDETLARYAVAPPAGEVGRRIANALLRRRGRRSGMRQWLSGLGAMGVLGVGALAGAAAMAFVAIATPLLPDGDSPGGIYEQTSFGDLIGADDALANPERS